MGLLAVVGNSRRRSGGAPPSDVDAEAYFTRTGITNSTEKAKITNFIIGLKGNNLYSDLGFLMLCRSTQNVGTGNTIHEFKSSANNGTLNFTTPVLAWNTYGLTFSATNHWVGTNYSMTMNHNWTSGVVMRCRSFPIYSRILGAGALSSKSTIMYFYGTGGTPSSLITGVFDLIGGPTVSGGNVSNWNQHTLSWQQTAKNLISFTGGAQNATTTPSVGLNVGTHNVSFGSPNTSEYMNDSDLALVYIFPNRTLVLSEHQAIHALLKSTICNDLSLP